MNEEVLIVMKKAWVAAALTFFGLFALVALLKVLWVQIDGGDPMVLFTTPQHLLFLITVFGAAAVSSYCKVKKAARNAPPTPPVRKSCKCKDENRPKR